MLFPTHLVAAFLLAGRWDLPPAWTVAGAALPDLVDKPIATAGLYPLFHSAGHSLVVFLAATSVAVGVLAVGRDALLRRVGPAVWVGWASHLALDAVHMPLNGRPGDVGFLAWPLLEHVPAVRLPPLEFAVHYLGTPAFFLEIGVWLAVVVVLARRAVR